MTEEEIAQLKVELLEALKQILQDKGYESYPAIPPFCNINQRIPTELDIKMTILVKKTEKI